MLRLSAITPQFRFDDTTQRYRASNGQFVAREAVKAASEAYVQKAQNDIISASQRLKDGLISGEQWQREMMDGIRRVHLTSHAIAVGGWDKMTPREYGFVGQRIKGEYEYLRGFSRDIQNGVFGPDLQSGNLLGRAQQYATAGRATYEKAQVRKAAEELGHDEERNILGAGDHCDGCLTEDAREWVAIGELVPVGSRTCRSNCQCRIATRKSTQE